MRKCVFRLTKYEGLKYFGTLMMSCILFDYNHIDVIYASLCFRISYYWVKWIVIFLRIWIFCSAKSYWKIDRHYLKNMTIYKGNGSFKHSVLTSLADLNNI